MNRFRIKFIGSRVVKTGVAVFLTSLICQLIGWPAVFAVITAIVTIEPTVSDSIKKGIVRLPASAIGSAYAVFFIFLFGNSPITYTAAAVFTIITCFKLKLRDGLLVATLTSVAMIEVIHSNFLISFFIRLGTTSIGLLVSTFVNMFVLPPNYSSKIMSNIHSLLRATGEELEVLTNEIFPNKHKQEKNELLIKQTFAKLKRELDQTDMLVRFQKEEARYHRFNDEQKKLFEDEQEKIAALRLIHYHIGNLINTPFTEITWSNQECHALTKSVYTIADTMKYPDHFSLEKHREQITSLMEQFWLLKRELATNETSNTSTFFTAEIIILYELLSIYNLVEELLVDFKTEEALRE
ncbi:aromatic acid exporter family protein [Aquibacillus koreensis]|uniref:Aromatic acid exporter family protein n=1 Tax=Aquibacillus koreensis TaxID=279446 RepID=A0A9X3WQM7_9BACI|nr:aromatic acid exporter family protein [Aquibacillus koreensis]MCT2537231.1 aromatic acid exporter family protein [Aquibacillus koreensis]MDC3421579.1 aromatic acid exporter family protein [Aquibacillus koreensis]